MDSGNQAVSDTEGNRTCKVASSWQEHTNTSSRSAWKCSSEKCQKCRKHVAFSSNAHHFFEQEIKCKKCKCKKCTSVIICLPKPMTLKETKPVGLEPSEREFAPTEGLQSDSPALSCWTTMPSSPLNFASLSSHFKAACACQ